MLHRSEWVDVLYVSSTLVTNAGDYLSLTTNGRCLSSVHRVVADGRERYSMEFYALARSGKRQPSQRTLRARATDGTNFWLTFHSPDCWGGPNLLRFNSNRENRDTQHAR